MRSLLVALIVQAVLPPLPRIAIESLPPPARESLSQVYRAAASQPDNRDAVGTLAKTLQAWEMWDAAHETYARLQQLDPKAFDWRYLDGVVLQRLAQPGEAAARFREALAISPEYLPARVKLAEALFDSGQAAESQTLFTALVKEPAAEPIAELYLGRLAASEGKHAAAVTHFERAVALFPELGAAHYALARSYRALGRQDDARRALVRHEQYGPRWPTIADRILTTVVALKDDAREQIERGMKLAQEGDLAGAIAAHEAALVRAPSLADAHANLISLYGRAREWAKAEEHYRALVALGVNLGDAHYDYGVLLGLQEKWDAAADAYRQALAVNPLHAQASNNLGQVLERQRQVEDALKAYRAAVASQPGFRLARFNLGRMLIAVGAESEAIAELEKLQTPRDAETPRYLFALSVAHVRAGHKDEGIKWATEARRLALEFGQHDLAAAIERNLATLK